ncbi:MAG TPA: SpoIIE family protein phosphatase, partial [Bacteroidia bacterium]|nr:SpoIIE family protein phosphatase [Bacteroidia bacterium]
GAFMSLLGNNILENIIQTSTTVIPGTILSKLNDEIVARFSKGKKREDVKHAMDIAFITLNRKKMQIQYAGAKNSLYLIRENQLTEIKADKMSTGIAGKNEDSIKYTNHIINLKKDDLLYLFSDGFPDQKGGPEKKKFYYQPFKDLLLSIHQLPLKVQQQKLDTAIIQWKGANEQIDDILIMGIRC